MVGRPPTDHLPTTFLRCSLFTITNYRQTICRLTGFFLAPLSSFSVIVSACPMDLSCYCTVILQKIGKQNNHSSRAIPHACLFGFNFVCRITMVISCGMTKVIWLHFLMHNNHYCFMRNDRGYLSSLCDEE